MRLLAVAVVLTYALLPTRPVAAQAVFRLPSPPPEFKPDEASAADLAKYGLPTRPNVLLRDTTSYKTWVRIMSAARKRVEPVVRMTGRRRSTVQVARALPRRGGTGYTYNWAGVAITNSATSYGPASYTEVLAQWVVTAVQQAIGTCNPLDVSATWVGMDGFSNSDVVQAGTESDAYCGGGVVSTDYYAWFEWAPNYEYEITNFAVYPGAPIFVVVQAYSATAATATFVNMQSNEYTTVGFNAPAGTSFAGSSAEWIIERPQLGNAPVTSSLLADYGLIWMSSEVAFPYGFVQSGIYYSPGDPPRGQAGYALNMVDSAGNLLAESFPQGLSALYVNVVGTAY